MRGMDILVEHWPTVLENVGIVGGLIFTGLALWNDTRVRRAETLLKITAQHRELWMEITSRVQLSGLFDQDRDLGARPLTLEEARFIGLLINHLRATFYASKAGIFVQPHGVGADIKSFFSKPGPKSVWEQTRREQDPKFVAFVDRWLA